MEGLETLNRAKCSSKYKNLCVIIFCKKDTQVKYLEELSKVLNNFKEDPVHINIMEMNYFDPNAFLNSVISKKVGLGGVYGFIANPPKKKIYFIKGGYDPAAIQNEIEKALSGSTTYLRFRGDFEDFIYSQDEKYDL